MSSLRRALVVPVAILSVACTRPLGSSSPSDQPAAATASLDDLLEEPLDEPLSDPLDDESYQFEQIFPSCPSPRCDGPASVQVDLTQHSGSQSPSRMRTAEGHLRTQITEPMQGCETRGYSGTAFVTLSREGAGLRLTELLVNGPSTLGDCVEDLFQAPMPFDVGPSVPLGATLEVEIRLDAVPCPTLQCYSA